MSLNQGIRNQYKPWLNWRVNDLTVDGILTINKDQKKEGTLFLYIDQVNGSNTGDGSGTNPVKTIEQAIVIAKTQSVENVEFQVRGDLIDIANEVQGIVRPDNGVAYKVIDFSDLGNLYTTITLKGVTEDSVQDTSGVLILSEPYNQWLRVPTVATLAPDSLGFIKNITRNRWGVLLGNDVNDFDLVGGTDILDSSENYELYNIKTVMSCPDDQGIAIISNVPVDIQNFDFQFNRGLLHNWGPAEVSLKGCAISPSNSDGYLYGNFDMAGCALSLSNPVVASNLNDHSVEYNSCAFFGIDVGVANLNDSDDLFLNNALLNPIGGDVLINRLYAENSSKAVIKSDNYQGILSLTYSYINADVAGYLIEVGNNSLNQFNFINITNNNVQGSILNMNAGAKVNIGSICTFVASLDPSFEAFNVVNSELIFGDDLNNTTVTASGGNVLVATGSVIKTGNGFTGAFTSTENCIILNNGSKMMGSFIQIDADCPNPFISLELSNGSSFSSGSSNFVNNDTGFVVKCGTNTEGSYTKQNDWPALNGNASKGQASEYCHIYCPV